MSKTSLLCWFQGLQSRWIRRVESSLTKLVLFLRGPQKIRRRRSFHLLQIRLSSRARNRVDWRAPLTSWEGARAGGGISCEIPVLFCRTVRRQKLDEHSFQFRYSLLTWSQTVRQIVPSCAEQRGRHLGTEDGCAFIRQGLVNREERVSSRPRGWDWWMQV